MAYVTPIITDRTPADIAAQNSKAFFNIVDHSRVYGNSLEANTALVAAIGVPIIFDTLIAVFTSDIETVANINILTTNIERMRLFTATYLPWLAADPDLVEIKDDWISGQTNPAPNFINVNNWEKVVDIIYQAFKLPYTPSRPAITGIAISGAGRTRNHGYR